MDTRGRGHGMLLLVVGVISIVLGLIEVFSKSETAWITFWTLALGLLLTAQGTMRVLADRKASNAS